VPLDFLLNTDLSYISSQLKAASNLNYRPNFAKTTQGNQFGSFHTSGLK
jgi:hypothetical protein